MLDCVIACIIIFLAIYEEIVKTMHDRMKLIIILYIVFSHNTFIGKVKASD